MKIKTITTTSDPSKTRQLERSLLFYGYDYHFIEHGWNGFLGKLHETYKYLKTLEGYTHFLYTDAWDTFALANESELYKKMPEKGLLIGAERACYPYTDWAERYPGNPSPWKYVNGGGWCGEIAEFIKIYEAAPPRDEMNDQVWLTLQFLNKNGNITLDYGCNIFQTLGHCPKTDFNYSMPFRNETIKSQPLFIHGNGHHPMDEIYALLPPKMDNLNEVQSQWEDKPEAHKAINDAFVMKVNDDPILKEYRDYIEANAYGFGERSFVWMWKLILQEFPDPEFLEIGVYRGQILALIRLLSPGAKITGITPLNTTGGFHESDYRADIANLHKRYDLKQPKLIEGLSTDPEIINQAEGKTYDIIYIDGGHDYQTARSDIYLYSGLVKIGGLLVIDDCGNKYNMPDGYFRGIDTVSKAVDELLPNVFYKELFSVVHIRVFKRIK